MNQSSRSLTALLLGVAQLDVLAGFGRVHLAAVRDAQVVQMSTERLQGGVDAGVRAEGRRLLIGKGFVFQLRRELHRVWGVAVPVVIHRGDHEVIHPRRGRSGGPGRPEGPASPGGP